MARSWLRRAIAWSAGLLVAESIVVWFAPGWAGVAVNVVAFACFAWLARRTGLGAGEVGVDRAAVARTIRLGIILSIVTVGLVAVAALVWSNECEQAPADLPLLLLRLLRVLVVTSCVEEFLFRGVLFAAWRRAFPSAATGARHVARRIAPWIYTGVCYGLWHIGPTHDTLAFCGREPSVVAIAGPVLFTTVIGALVFAPLRDRTGSIAVPVLVHFSANATGIVTAYLIG
jgi:membrane protease YdiL (CAAX protease family)